VVPNYEKQFQPSAYQPYFIFGIILLQNVCKAGRIKAVSGKYPVWKQKFACTFLLPAVRSLLLLVCATFFQSLHRFSGQENWTRDVHLCTTCGLGFTSGNLLAAHRVNCTDEKRHSQRKSNVKSEKVPQESNGKKMFRCDRCDRQFTQWGAVATHVKTVHDKIREFKCPTCGAEFGKKGNLEQHILTVHQKIRDFPCSECGQRFTTGGNLKAHIDGVHLQIKHPCDQCDYQATKEASLADHKKRLHSGGPSVPCLFCPAKFALPADAEKHAKRVHPEVKFLLFCNIFLLFPTIYIIYFS
jgi:uncharacterized C2H2 Zn-finger protein